MTKSMSKQYYIAGIMGDGTHENAFRPAVEDPGVLWEGRAPSDAVTGYPAEPRTVALVHMDDRERVVNAPGIDVLPG